MGNGWTHSYEISIRPCRGNFVLTDGTGRHDLYLHRPDGTWAKDGFFRELIKEPDGSFTLLFPDKGSWSFHAFDGSPWQGKIHEITDRNGNTIKLAYDGEGKLYEIRDTLNIEADDNRIITIGYNDDGLIETVTDFIGRQVRYEYYQGAEAGGSTGDLESVTSPIVIGTPTGNDFPNGKTVIYTYSKGFEDERLNHNLLTITGPKGQVYVRNIYFSTEDPGARDFDRVKRQIWGGADDIIDIRYRSRVPTPGNNFSVMLAIINDRVGNVQEHKFDAENRLVLRRDYTGRADADQYTDLTQNRPMGKLRPDDPDFFVTRYSYNVDSQLTRIEHPEGNITERVYQVDLDPTSPRRSRGNMRQLRRIPGARGGDQTEIVELFEYDNNFGGCCGMNFVTRHIDGQGSEILHEYDNRGNRLRTWHRIPTIIEGWQYNSSGQLTTHVWPDNGDGYQRRDEFTYYEDGAQRGYSMQRIVDAETLSLTTVYQYDSVGNAIRIIDPRGADKRLIYNQLDEVVRTLSRQITINNKDIRYTQNKYFDENGNVVRLELENINDRGDLENNAYWTTEYEYDILNVPVRFREEVGPGHFAVTEYEYDANRNRVLVRGGEATNNNQPENIVQFQYDERDLLFQETRGVGPDQSTTQYDYDGNRNVRRVHDGIEADLHITEMTYDGYDRMVRSVDPMGNERLFHYDENNNKVRHIHYGELLDVPGGGDNVHMREISYIYDAMDRMTQIENEFFDVESQLPISDGKSVTQMSYSDCSQVIRTTNDNGNEQLIAYDTANRTKTRTDAKGNILTLTYDNNSNIITTERIEKSDLGAPDTLYSTTTTYDNLDRRVQAVDSVGNTVGYGYNSRDARTLKTDALNYESRYAYDGLNRLIQSVRDMDGDGANKLDPDDTVLSQSWDDSSRLKWKKDGNGNVSTFTYDALNRVIVTTYADGTQRGYTYDIHDNRISSDDAVNSVVTCIYDALDRLTDKYITPGPSVSNDTTFENLSYDGLSRLVRAEDDDSVVARSYDSLSHLTRETINGLAVVNTYDGVGKRLSCSYPGGRVIEYGYDELERKKTIGDATSGQIARYDYIGAHQIARRLVGNVEMTHQYDGARRVTETKHTRDPAGTPAIIDHWSYSWDAMYNKTTRSNMRPNGKTYSYEYDAAHRLVRLTTTKPDSQPSTIDYQMDKVGNRLNVNGGPHAGAYSMQAALPEPGDHQMNQYSTTSFDNRRYDQNGNLVEIWLQK